MKRLYWILVILVVDVLFKLYRPTGNLIGFPSHPKYWNGQANVEIFIARDTYAYFIFQHITMMLFYALMWRDAYKWAFVILIGLEILDLANFLYSYNKLEWGFITLNVIKCSVFGGTVIYYAITRNNDGN